MMEIIKTIRLHNELEENKGGNGSYKMCEFDGSNQPCTTRYHNILKCITMILPSLHAIYNKL
jgi:hypothetical protein